ncbi:unnamed protein product, partial [Cyprideis torosa]
NHLPVQNESRQLSLVRQHPSKLSIIPSTWTFDPGSNSSDQFLIMTLEAGQSGIGINRTDITISNPEEAFMRVTIFKSYIVETISFLIGWIYTIAWSISFYPQVYTNWKRRSVRGLSLDFVVINLVGFLCYNAFNCALYWSNPIQEQYYERHPMGVIPVTLNDVGFSLHACVLCSITLLQCFVYERGAQSGRISGPLSVCLGLCCLVAAIAFALTIGRVIILLDFLYILGYIKLFITLIKYIPQVYFNYQRKSTCGWSIHTVLLDVTGGTFSITQMMLLAYNHDDWGSVLGDPTKLGLGFISISFDAVFIVQHYFLYKDSGEGYEWIADPEVTMVNPDIDTEDSEELDSTNQPFKRD